MCFVPVAGAEDALALMRSHELGSLACQIGEVSEAPADLVTLQSHIGVNRIVDMLSGERLPRIC